MIGSVWNKWDLHLHSPLSHLANEYNGSDMASFADRLIESDLTQIGITNYFYFADNELEGVRDALQSKGSNINVLGNLEFRISQPNKDGEFINIHCIFHQSLATSVINERMRYLELFNRDSYGNPIQCSKDSIHSSNIGIGNVVVDYNTLVKHLKKRFKFGREVILAICPRGYGSFRPPQKNPGRAIHIAYEFDRDSHIAFGTTEDKAFFLNETRVPCGIASKPVFHASDAHTLNKVGSAYTWVKAKPTFEGLRQCVIEPDARVYQDSNFIELSYQKPYFCELTVNGKIIDGDSVSYRNKTIPINKNLVTIIGGRGTGKSLLLDVIGDKLGRNVNRKTNSSCLSIKLDQGNGEIINFDSNDGFLYEYLHVSQGQIKSFSESSETLSYEIKKMLGIHDQTFNTVEASSIRENLNRYHQYVEYRTQVNHANEYINFEGHQEEVIRKNKQLISTLTSPDNQTLINAYQANLKIINDANNYIRQLNELKGLIERSLHTINQDIKRLNTNSYTSRSISLIGLSTSLNEIEYNITTTTSAVSNAQKQNVVIVERFKTQGINIDITSILSKVSEYQLEIDNAKSKLLLIEQRNNQANEDITTRYQHSIKYRNYLENNVKLISDAYSKLRLGNEHWNKEQNEIVQDLLKDIIISGKIIFDIDEFYLGLENCINRGKFRASSDKTTKVKLQEKFGIYNIDDLFTLLAGHNLISDETFDSEKISLEAFLWKSEFFNQSGRMPLVEYLYSHEKIASYLYVNADFTYKGKTIEKLSVGQRGTFYVCLKLASDPFGSPFVFDQPEDDLDNEFIMDELVPLFRKIKKYRQVIIVTHNANLVVNSDAEQVIVAENSGDLISYSAGALEEGDVDANKGTRSKVCNILEGGKFAFISREHKYGFQR